MKRKAREVAFSRKLKGSRNILFPASEVYEEVRRKSSDFLKSSGFKELILSSFDYESTFTSSIGEGTDIVQKEIFTFSDKKGRKIALRPEGTACVAKMFFQKDLSKDGGVEKVFYWGNMFRYERPQKGRYREFWQLGVEIINSSSKIASDCELLNLASSLLDKIEIKKYSFFINYLGNQVTIKNYSDKLKELFSVNPSSLCETCKSRFLINPLRIIDCEKCSNLEQIPSYDDFLSDDDISYFKRLTFFLSTMKINFTIDKKLVRGINYYNGLVFECKVEDENKSILGGGRYDNLVARSDVQNLSSVGFAIGVDRLIDFCKQQRIKEIEEERRIDLLFVILSEEHFLPCFVLKNEIQKKLGILVDFIVLDSSKNQKISKVLSIFKPSFSAFYGNKENETEEISVINHNTGHKFLVKKELLTSWIANQLNKLGKDSSTNLVQKED